ncbi:protein phosphatase 2C, putative [Eimeria maxima]|uniref:Protein phosphatase 2C, putative n=1 Tax=Eimeria maxima TaxID=5804 RepID=U6M3D7_EIMMA|nr:protein phosphatase 2C, putative [Eimeria maxima]CDJ56959.1 protein phosphatase 2C, putative [Eimeria maxima]
MGGTSQQPSTLLAVSRSFGDKDLKVNNILTVIPDVILFPLFSSLLFIVIACDGVWDTMTDQDNLTAMLVMFD